MDKTGYIVVTICFLLLGYWLFESEKLARQQMTTQHPAQPAAQQAQEQVSAPGSNQISQTSQVIPSSTNVPERFLTITNDRVRYTFTSRGGGIKSVGFLDFPETISPRWQKGTGTNAVATLNDESALPIMTILGGPSLVGDGDFTLTPGKTSHGVEAEKSLPNGLVLTKDFEFTSNYLVTVTVTFKNDSGKPLSLPEQQWVTGTATPMDIDDLTFMSYGGAMWYDGANLSTVPATYFSTNTSVLGIFPRTPKTEYREGNGNVLWAAAYNQFFALLVMPETNQPASQIVANPVTLTAPDGRMPMMGVQTALIYPAGTLAADQVVMRHINVYAGPKEFRTLVKVADQFQNRADLVMNFGTGFAAFFGIGSFFAKLLLWLLNALHDLLPWLSYGWIIVLLTVLLRLFFWPFTAASMRSMKKMQALAPQIQELKEKYGQDPQKFTEKQMELWRKNKVNPMSGCFPMLIQMPVFIGLYTMIRSAFELRGAHFLWISDLTKPDTIFFIPFIGIPFNLLPLIMVGVLVWQAHVQPMSPGMDPSQQKMMRYMPLIFLLILYNYSAGMALYMTVSTLMGILQTRLTKKMQVAVAPAVSPLAPQPKKKK